MNTKVLLHGYFYVDFMDLHVGIDYPTAVDGDTVVRDYVPVTIRQWADRGDRTMPIFAHVSKKHLADELKLNGFFRWIMAHQPERKEVIKHATQ